ncbi:MAG TPA: VCBS repeat-containing protein [Verrucomicrobiales bacterium]|nr:VCBS repeat-containing protein [Verrucomicrobiales bacterium]
MSPLSARCAAAFLCVLLAATVARAQQPISLDDLDPSGDGWPSEALTEDVTAVLSQLGDWLCAETENGSPAPPPAAMTAPGAFRGSAPSLDRPEVFHAGPTFSIRRHRDPPEDKQSDNLASLLEPLRQRFAGGRPDALKSKTVETLLGPGNEAQTSHLVEISGPAQEGGLLEIHSTWRIEWLLPDSAAPRLRSIRITNFEEAHTTRDRPLFTDASAEVLTDVPAWEAQLRFGTDYWQSRIENYFQIHLFGQRGLALGDVDGDGLDDLYVCQPGGLPNRLLLHQPDHGVLDLSRAAGVDFLDNTNAALFVDLDNDGDQDLVVALSGGLLFLEQSAPLRFTRRALIGNLADGQSLCAADYDLDGDLDIYLCSYYADSAAAGDLALPVPYFDANNGGPNILLRNDGDFVFRDATAESGLDENNRRWSWAAMWADCNGDGLEDLYVANDFGRNNLYLARREKSGAIRFRDAAADAGLRAGAFGMSVSAADFDRDGKLDFYVGNMFSSAGSRITHQPQFQPGAGEDLLRKFRHLAKGNTLFRNLGNQAAGDGPHFAETGESAGVTMGRWSWSAPFTDFNNDGWEDLVVANGYVTGGKQEEDL